MFGLVECLYVKTEWNCMLNRSALSSGVVTRVSLRALRAAMLVVSCLHVMKKLKKCLGLFLTLSVRYLLIWLFCECFLVELKSSPIFWCCIIAHICSLSFSQWKHVWSVSGYFNCH